jgi:hypothetical protein
MMDGFYVAYMTGNAGTSVLLFVVMQGRLIGADVGGLKYDGTIQQKPDGSGFTCSIVYVVPAGGILITGAPPQSEAVRVPLTFDLPNGFTDGRVITIQTPLGPVNAKFEKIRDV